MENHLIKTNYMNYFMGYFFGKSRPLLNPGHCVLSHEPLSIVNLKIISYHNFIITKHMRKRKTEIEIRVHIF